MRIIFKITVERIKHGAALLTRREMREKFLCAGHFRKLFAGFDAERFRFLFPRRFAFSAHYLRSSARRVAAK